MFAAGLILGMCIRKLEMRLRRLKQVCSILDLHPNALVIISTTRNLLYLRRVYSTRRH